MLAHYSKSLTGVVLIYKHEGGISNKEVKYYTSSEYKENMHEDLMIKGKTWEYEKEYRLISDNPGMQDASDHSLALKGTLYTRQDLLSWLQRFP